MNREIFTSLDSIRENFMENALAVLNNSQLDDAIFETILALLFAMDGACRDFSKAVSQYMEQ